MMKNLKHLAAAAVLAVSAPAVAATPTETGEDCPSNLSQDDAMTFCDDTATGAAVFCDTKGEVPGGGCNAAVGLCKCYFVGSNGCLNDYHCNAQSFCNENFECELNAVADGGVDGGTDGGMDAGTGSGGGLDSGCSSTGGAVALFPLLLAGLAFRTRRNA